MCGAVDHLVRKCMKLSRVRVKGGKLEIFSLSFLFLPSHCFGINPMDACQVGQLFTCLLWWHGSCYCCFWQFSSISLLNLTPRSLSGLHITISSYVGHLQSVLHVLSSVEQIAAIIPCCKGDPKMSSNGDLRDVGSCESFWEVSSTTSTYTLRAANPVELNQSKCGSRTTTGLPPQAAFHRLHGQHT